MLSPSVKDLHSRNSHNAPKSSFSDCHAFRSRFTWGTGPNSLAEQALRKIRVHVHEDHSFHLNSYEEIKIWGQLIFDENREHWYAGTPGEIMLLFIKHKGHFHKVLFFTSLWSIQWHKEITELYLIKWNERKL